MENKKFTDRSVDKLPVQKSKKYLWSYLQTKIDMTKKNVEADVGDRRATFIKFFKSLFRMPERLVSGGVIATLVIVALLFSSVLTGWFGVKVQTVHADFEMTAEQQDGSGVASDSGFILTSSEDLSTDIIKTNLKLEPSVNFDVTKTAKAKYEIKPGKGLEANKIYNFTILTEKGESSWAYQIQDSFKIDGTLPADKTNAAPTNTGIEINFSNENFDFEHAKDYFEISPKVDGHFEHHARILAFVPSNPLQEGVFYTVKIKQGFKLNNSNKTLAADYIFKFETRKTEMYLQNFHFVKKYYEMASNTTIAMDMYAYDFTQSGKKDVQIQVYKYADVEAYIAALRKSSAIPDWAYYSRDNYQYPSEGLQDMGTVQGLISSPGGHSYVYLPDQAFDKGYYLFQVDDNGGRAQALVQITDLSAYTTVSSTDTLVWVNDLTTGKPVANTTITVGDSGKTYTTGQDGVVRFKTPDEWKSNSDALVPTFIKATSQDGKILVTQLDNFNNDISGDNAYWSTFISDRAQYKPTDSINFWGFIKPKAGTSKLDNLKMKLLYNWDTYVQDVPFEMSDDGTFKGKLDVKNLTPGSYYLELKQGDKTLMSNGIEIDDYIKPAYNVTVEPDKKAVFAGDTVKFKTKAEFFDGTAVANLSLSDNKDQYTIGGSAVGNILTTDTNGLAETNITTKKNDCVINDCYDEQSIYYSVSSKDGEETNISANTNVRVFNSHLNISSDAKVDDKDGKSTATISFKTNLIDLTKLNSDQPSGYQDYIGEIAKNRKMSGKIVEISWEKQDNGEFYNFITKTTEKIYNYVEKKRDLTTFDTQTDANGEGSYSFEIDPTKFYSVYLKSDDDQGLTAHATSMVYGSMSNNLNDTYYDVQILNKAENGSQSQFDVGDTVDAAIVNNNSILDKSSKGSFLFMKEVNGIQDYSIKDSPYYSFKFTKDNIPNIYVDGVWFNGKLYQHAYSTSADYKTELKRLTVKVQSDKTSYKPGDDVNLSVAVTNKDGAPVSAKVNFNVVDEAYYKAVYSYLSDPLTAIYQDNNTGILASYASHFNPLLTGQGEGGKGGCFTGDTQISMADGTTKAIKDIKKGDKILTRENEDSGRLVSGEVIGTVKKHVGSYMLINDKLEVTAEHVVLANGIWKHVSSLKIGDSMMDKDGNIIQIFSIKQVVKPVDVFNIEIKNYHTYFANGFFVHNEKGDGYYLRQNFKDTALFYTVDTGANGLGSVKFKAPDNITSWRIVTRAIDIDGLQAGVETTNIKVTLPFFVDLILNREYSVQDKPMIKLRAYGDNLKDGDTIQFKASVDDKTEETSINGKAFTGTYYNLPTLAVGNHNVTVKGDANNLKDAIKKPFEIKGSRLTQEVVKTINNVSEQTNFDLGKQGPTEIDLIDGGVAAYYSNLLDMAYAEGGRLDQVIARKSAIESLKKYFAKDFPIYDEENGNYILSAYQRNGGLSLLPYSSNDIKLSALAVAFDSSLERYSRQPLRDYFYTFYKNSKSNLDDVVLSLLGLASMKEPVLLSLREIQKAPELTIQEKLYIGLAFEKLGSYSEARAVLKDLGDKLAPDTSLTGLYNSALGAVLAAGLNEKTLADALWKVVDVTGFHQEDLSNLYELGYVNNSLKNANFQPAEFKFTLNSHEENVKLGNEESKSLMAVVGDKLKVAISSGSVTAVLHYAEGVEASAFKKDERLSINRTYIVNGNETNTFKEGDLVKVLLYVKMNSPIDRGTLKITDILPSGLTPVNAYQPMDAGFANQNISYPYMINGQEINFAWFPLPPTPMVTPPTITSLNNPGYTKIYYYAKVVNPGEFYADPARVESFYDNSIANISEPSTIEIKPIK